jgi:hypothetical protein
MPLKIITVGGTVMTAVLVFWDNFFCDIRRLLSNDTDRDEISGKEYC